MKRGVVLLVLIGLGLGGALGATIWLLLDPPFLTWQHRAELAPALQRYAAEAERGAVAEVWRVREYTDSCSVVRATLKWPDDSAGLGIWALLYRVDDTWQVFWTETDAGLAPVLAWGQVCARREAPIPALELPEPPEQ
jgi:hypothetical protein